MIPSFFCFYILLFFTKAIFVFTNVTTCDICDICDTVMTYDDMIHTSCSSCFVLYVLFILWCPMVVQHVAPSKHNFCSFIVWHTPSSSTKHINEIMIYHVISTPSSLASRSTPVRAVIITDITGNVYYVYCSICSCVSWDRNICWVTTGLRFGIGVALPLNCLFAWPKRHSITVDELDYGMNDMEGSFHIMRDAEKAQLPSNVASSRQRCAP